MLEGDKVEPVDTQLASLRSSIRDLHYQVESDKTKTAAALGGGVFLALLSMLAAYDLAANKDSVWRSLQITSETLSLMAGVLGFMAAILLIVGFRRARRSDGGVKAKLDSLEREYEALIDRKESTQTRA